MTADPHDTAPADGRRIAFDGGSGTLVALVLAFATLAALSVALGNVFAGVDFPAWVDPLVELGTFVLLAGIALVLLRYEGVRPVELGLSRRQLAPAVLTFVGVWVALNVIAAGLATATGNLWGVEQLANQPVRWPDLPAPLVVSLLFDFLVVALVEEFVFRGYLQSKVIAVLGDGSRLRIGLGVALAALLFGAMHAPGAIVAGASLPGVLSTVLFLTLSGIFFGTLYEVTHNVYLVALLHALGNTWPLVADVWTWSGLALVGSFAAVGVVYFGGALAYRDWMGTPERSRVSTWSVVR